MKSDAAFRLGMAQVNFLVGDIEGNTSKILEYVKIAQQQAIQLLVFPELSLTGYPPEDLLLRDGLHRRVEKSLKQLCSVIGNTAIIIGYPRRLDGQIYNMAGLIRDGKILAEYKKQRLPNYSVFDEKRYFNAGDQPCVIEFEGIPLGITICEDAWNPAPIKQSVAAGARMIINLNASPYQLNKSREREQMLKARVAENQVPIIYVNLLGGQDELVFDGESVGISHQGDVVCRAPAFEEGVYAIACQSQDGAVELQSEVCRPVLDPVAGAYQALVLGVRDYINKNRFRGAVIGLSGGVDSALTLAIAVDALGADQVEGVSMPSRYTMDMSIEDAREEAETLGINFQIIEIEPVFKAFLSSLKDEFAGKPVDTTEENIQARCRGVMLMAISNKKGKMVLTTGNKSEMSVGYATLYGDMAGGFCVLKDVPKTLVYEMCHYRNSLQAVIPERVITRPPSAELAPDQKDEDSLPPYDVLDDILERYIEKDQCASDIIEAGFAADVVYKVTRLVDINEYKRRQAAPGIKITHKAFGRDRRYPITSGFGRYAPE